MTKKFTVFDRLPPEHQKIIRDYWKDIKNESRQIERQKQKLRNTFR